MDEQLQIDISQVLTKYHVGDIFIALCELVIEANRPIELNDVKMLKNMLRDTYNQNPTLYKSQDTFALAIMYDVIDTVTGGAKL